MLWAARVSSYPVADESSLSASLNPFAFDVDENFAIRSISRGTDRSWLQGNQHGTGDASDVSPHRDRNRIERLRRDGDGQERVEGKRVHEHRLDDRDVKDYFRESA